MSLQVAAAFGLLAIAGVIAQSNTPAVSHEYADVNGVRLHYAKAGRGPLMVFLHGFPEFWYEWKHQIAEFSRDHTVAAPDMRGYNLSSKPNEVSAYEMPHLVEDVRAFATMVRATGESKFTLVGHDWGGVVAWVFAALHPEMLDKLVIVNAPHPAIFGQLLAGDPAQQLASAYMLMLRSPVAEATLSANSFGWLVSTVLESGIKAGTVTDADRQAYLEAWSQPGALTGGLNYYRASGIGPGPRGAAAAAGTTATTAAPMIVRVPTLVIWGEADTALITRNLDGLDALVPDLTIRRIADGTHWVVREQPVLVNQLMREFLAQH